MSADFRFAVIGAGVVGLAIAAELSVHGSVLVIEREWKFGQSTSSHNSEVVHAGIYYAPQSLKARLCVAGNRMIQEIAAKHGIGFRRTGKYIVATTDDEVAFLEKLKANAEACGVGDLSWTRLDEFIGIEPDVKGAIRVLHSPSSGIVDSHGLMSHFKSIAEQSGAEFAFRAEVVGARRTSEGYLLTVREAEGSITEIVVQSVINSAGLHADKVAEMFGIDVRSSGLELHWTRGFYYGVDSALGLQIRHLIYPVPEKSLKSLGVHATIDLAGGLRFGPTAEYMSERREDYSLDDSDLNRVAESVSRYIPEVKPEHLYPIMAGIRPKLTAPGQPPRDFYIQEERERGLPGLVNLIGIESPGLTASPAIAKMVSELATVELP